MSQEKKIKSKFLRMKLSEDIKKIINISGVKNLQETQIGDFIYRGHGVIQLGSFDYEVILSIKLFKEEPKVTLSLPQVKLITFSTLNLEEFKEKSRKLFLSVLN